MDINQVAQTRILDLEDEVLGLETLNDLQRAEIEDLREERKALKGQLANLLADRRYEVSVA